MATQSFNYSFASLFPQMTFGDSLVKVFAYGAMAVSCMIAWGFIYRFVPETKDRTLDECV
jgi:hypothetical protein